MKNILSAVVALFLNKATESLIDTGKKDKPKDTDTGKKDTPINSGD